MPNLLEEHLELERIFWSAGVDEDANEWVELSLRMCEVLDQKLKREIGEDVDYTMGCITFSASSEYWADS